MTRRKFTPEQAMIDAFVASLETAPGRRARIMREIRACGVLGATCDEVEVALGMPHQTASARVHELQRMGLIQPTGSARYTRWGKRASVWVATLPSDDSEDEP